MGFLIILTLLSPASDEIGWLGVKGEEVSKPYRIALGIDHGVIITDLIEDSPAFKAGLLMGDVITDVDKRMIYDMGDLADQVRDNPDKKLRFKILRKGKKEELKIKIGKREKETDQIRGEIKRFIKQLKQEIEKLKDGRI